MRLNTIGVRAGMALGFLALITSTTGWADPAHGSRAKPSLQGKTAAPAPAPVSLSFTAVSAETLHKLMDAQQLKELRTTYNSNYGASLLFNPDDLSYYVAIFHDNKFLRIAQTDSYEDANGLYRSFALQTERLGQVDIDTLRLTAGNKYTARMIAANEERLKTLQLDADRQRDQAQQVATAQAQAQQQAVTLSTDLRSTSEQLDQVKQRIHALEVMQTSPEVLLPPPAPANQLAPQPAPPPAQP